MFGQIGLEETQQLDARRTGGKSLHNWSATDRSQSLRTSTWCIQSRLSIESRSMTTTTTIVLLFLHLLLIRSRISNFVPVWKMVTCCISWTTYLSRSRLFVTCVWGSVCRAFLPDLDIMNKNLRSNNFPFSLFHFFPGKIELCSEQTHQGSIV